MAKLHTEIAGMLNRAVITEGEGDKKKSRPDTKVLGEIVGRIGVATGLEPPKASDVPKATESLEATIASAHTCLRNDDLVGCRLIAMQLGGKAPKKAAAAASNGGGNGGDGGGSGD